GELENVGSESRLKSDLSVNSVVPEPPVGRRRDDALDRSVGKQRKRFAHVPFQDEGFRQLDLRCGRNFCAVHLISPRRLAKSSSASNNSFTILRVDRTSFQGRAFLRSSTPVLASISLPSRTTSPACSSIRMPTACVR